MANYLYVLLMVRAIKKEIKKETIAKDIFIEEFGKKYKHSKPDNILSELIWLGYVKEEAGFITVVFGRDGGRITRITSGLGKEITLNAYYPLFWISIR